MKGKAKRLVKDIEKSEKRKIELDAIIKKLFEQNALGVVSDERFITMSAGYEAEQKELKAKIAGLQNQLDEQEAAHGKTAKFLELVRKYSDIKELTAAVLNDLIDSIVMYDAEGKCMKKNRVQRVEINYKFVGLMQPDCEKSA